MRSLSILTALVLAAPVAAQSFDLRDGDERIARQEMTERLSGQTVRFFDDGASEYYADGRYTYTYANNGGTAYGYWRVEDEGAVCVEFVNGFSRCDLYVRNDGRLILLDEKGNRFPVRP